MRRVRGAVATLLGAAGLLLMSPAAPALAHAELGSSLPGAGSQQDAVPTRVQLAFTERPSAVSVVRVTDGCEHSVAGGVAAKDDTLTVRVDGGRPGTWHVAYDVVSSDDGHRSSGAYTFTVAGKPDCAGLGSQTVSVRPVATSDAGGGGLAVPLALGAVALVGAAVVVRRNTGP